MMRNLMGLVKNSHGVFLVRKKVPEKLQSAIARIMGSDKERVVWLQESLRTKDKQDASVRAKPVLAKFERWIAAGLRMLRSSDYFLLRCFSSWVS